MFNLQKQSNKDIKPTEKYIREDALKLTNDGDKIIEKDLDAEAATKETDEVIEKQIDKKHTVAESDSVVIEKAFERNKGYLPHRRNDAWLSVPPIAAVVEKLRTERMADWKEEKKSGNWTLNKSKQNGKLPAWPKSPDQHDKIVLNNDPRRFEGLKDFPKATDSQKTQSEKVTDVKPLVGNITKADIHNVAERIKTGSAVKFDAAIVAILREADKCNRELIPSERESINELKKARTKAILDEINHQ